VPLGVASLEIWQPLAGMMLPMMPVTTFPNAKSLLRIESSVNAYGPDSQSLASVLLQRSQEHANYMCVTVPFRASHQDCSELYLLRFLRGQMTGAAKLRSAVQDLPFFPWPHSRRFLRFRCDLAIQLIIYPVLRPMQTPSLRCS
jgi:hypothetical protein